MSLPKGSKWIIERSGVPDHKIEVTSSSGEEFTAKYIGISNPSEFIGEVWTRQTKAINIKQHDHSTGYVAFQTGLRKGTNNNKYEGSWYDNAGNSGQFSLTKL